MTELCYGCGACLAICPIKAITVAYRERGAPYYEIGEDCVQCGKCEKICPMGKELSHPEQKIFFRAITRHKDVLKKSSSGGLAFEISKSVILAGGVVYGAGWDAQSQIVRHMRVDSLAGLSNIQGSKYVQSLLEPDIYKSIVNDLSTRHVLMTGCPCQVAAVRNFTHDHPNLFCVDLICHGVPSAKLLDEQLKILVAERVETLSFRQGTQFALDVRCASSAYFSQGLDNPYYSLFLHFASLRESCYMCKFAYVKRVGDITLGDYEENNQGYSCLVSNTAKGDDIIQKIENDVAFAKRNIALLMTNHAFTKPTDKHPQTEKFTYLHEKYGLIRSYYMTFPIFIVKRRIRNILGETAYGMLLKLYRYIR